MITTPEYWTTNAQIDLYNCAEAYMEQSGKNRQQLAEHLGVSKSYVTQLLRGDYDHRLSNFIKLALSFGYVPKIDFIPIEDYVRQDKTIEYEWEEKTYVESTECKSISIFSNDYFTAKSEEIVA